MHQLSIADAIAQHRPTLVIFGSPALCVSRICGPEVHAVQSLEPQYLDRLTFIHIEPYQLKPQPNRSVLSPILLEWRLQSEPWIFLIDSRGNIRSPFEGPTDADEVQAAIDQLLASPCRGGQRTRTLLRALVDDIHNKRAVAPADSSPYHRLPARGHRY